MNIKKHQRVPLTSQMRQMMAAEFADDVQRLSRILQRDLGYWLVSADAVVTNEVTSN